MKQVPIRSLVNRVDSHMDRKTDQCFIIAKDTWTKLNLRVVNFYSEHNNYFKYDTLLIRNPKICVASAKDF